MKSKLRNLNLIGIPKAVAEATAEYIDSLEKQLLRYARLKEQGKLIELPALPGDKYYLESGEERVFTSVEEIVHFLPEVGKTISLSREKRKIQTSTYISRNQLSEETVEQLRASDREYYQEHKEEANKKDRDKYHILHPNARYYKKRKPPVEAD